MFLLPKADFPSDCLGTVRWQRPISLSHLPAMQSYRGSFTSPSPRSPAGTHIDGRTSFMEKMCWHSVSGDNYREWERRTLLSLFLRLTSLTMSLESLAHWSDPPQIVSARRKKKTQMETYSEGGNKCMCFLLTRIVYKAYQTAFFLLQNLPAPALLGGVEGVCGLTILVS